MIIESNEVEALIDRRDFLKRLGGGIVVLFTTGYSFPLAAADPTQSSAAASLNYNAYLRIAEDGRVSCFTGKIEMGQGIITSLAQMIADEIDVAPEMVDMVMGDTDLCPYDRGTWGSQSTRIFGPELRAAGAEAKAVLLELASEHLNVPADRLQVRDGIVYDTASDQRVSYGELTRGKQITRTLERKPPVKDKAAFKVMGQSFNRRDAREKVTGEARYAGDLRFPDMLYARILRPPMHGATLQSVDTSAAEAIDGVQIVRDGDLMAVLHRYRDEAEKALSKIVARFDNPEETVDDQTIYDHLLRVAPRGEVADENGNLEEGQRLASRVYEGTYYNAYVAHAPIEPHTAVARMENGKMTIWASTQSPFGVRDQVASELGLPAEQVRVITPFLGGGFGGKSSNRQAVEAARLAKLTGKPVQVAWSREEEFFYDTFRPAAVVKISSGLNGNGSLSFWDYHVYFAGDRGSRHFYDIPHDRTVVYGRGWTAPQGTHPFATGAWRAPGNNTNTFARESQIDIMASIAGVDPLEFRLNHLQDKKMQGVLQAAAERFGWTPAKAPSGRGFGISCGFDADTTVATMAEVDVDESTGNVTVKRVVCAQDMGLVINPAGAILQMESCITMGLGYALREEIHFKGGRILDLNFHAYNLPLFSWLPEIETVLVDSGDPVPHGGGEPAIVNMGAVIANAIFDATGARLFHLPMTPERVREAIARKETPGG